MPDAVLTAGGVNSRPTRHASRTFTITLPAQTRIGPVGGVASFPAHSAGGTPENLGGAAVPIAGEVIGRISASPAAAVFGTVAAGQEVVRVIRLDGEAGGVKVMRIDSTSPWVRGELARTEAGASLLVRLVRVRPVGALQSEITLTLLAGERLVIPVLAYTTSGAAR